MQAGAGPTLKRVEGGLADVTALFIDRQTWQTRREIYEVKPYSWTLGPGGIEEAGRQLQRYVDLWKRNESRNEVRKGGMFNAPMPGKVVPGHYVPVLDRAGVEVVLLTYEGVGPGTGVVFYYFRWKGKRPKNPEEVLTNTILEIAKVANPQIWADRNALRNRLAQLADEEGFYWNETNLYTFRDKSGNIDWIPIMGSAIENRLMNALVPDYFYRGVPLP